MRKCPIIAVHDSLIGYKSLTVEQNEAIAKRGFTNSIYHLLTSPDLVELSPEDLSLYKVGDFDLDTGEIDPVNPCLLVSGNDIRCKFNNDKVKEENHNDI